MTPKEAKTIASLRAELEATRNNFKAFRNLYKAGAFRLIDATSDNMNAFEWLLEQGCEGAAGVEVMAGKWRTQCLMCGAQYDNGVGSTPCCGSVQGIIWHAPGNNCKYHRDLPYLVKGCPTCKAEHSLAPARGSAALVREQDAANELYQAACCLMRYKEADQWHNLENAAHRFNAARQSRLNDEIMRQNSNYTPAD